jgi:protein SCO1
MYRTVFLKNSVGLLVLACLSWACNGKKAATQLPFYNTPDFTPRFLSHKKAIADSITHTIADFACVNQKGESVTRKTIEGKIHVANFFFTSCGSICPGMMKNMQTVRNAFKSDDNIVLLSYSVTPWIDSVSRLKKYAEVLGYDEPNWHLLTGSKAAIYTLARQSYFAEEDLGFSKDSTDFLHTEHFLLVDKHQRIRGIYNGTLPLEAEQLIQDIQTLKEEK